jgi:membrane protease YdiL (CAAX protease family)
MLNKKAIYIFLGITFGLTISMVIVARLIGFSLFDKPNLYSQIVILVAMFMPAVSAIFTHKFILKKPFGELGFRFGPWRAYLKAYLLIVGVFAVNYAITWIFFLKPDLTLNSFLSQYGNLTLPIPALQMILIFALITYFAAPIANLVPSLGEEIGWRGFLLPNLEPLGRTKAAIISGLIWGLWHTPMILLLGFFYGQQFWLGAVLHLALVTSLGVWMGYIWFETRSTVLAAFIHATFNANAYGFWAMIFVSDNKLLIGAGGLINVLLLVMVAAVTIKKLHKT